MSHETAGMALSTNIVASRLHSFPVDRSTVAAPQQQQHAGDIDGDSGSGGEPSEAEREEGGNKTLAQPYLLDMGFGGAVDLLG